MLSGRGIKSLSNLVIQLREVCNHPDLLESAFDGSFCYLIRKIKVTKTSSGRKPLDFIRKP
ncbi:hypothetical protein AAHE18_18G154300 [Arachis hypogaea]